MSLMALARPVLGVADTAAATLDDVARANPFNLTAAVFDDVDVAVTRIDESAGRIESMIAQHGDGPLDDAALAGTKDSRIGAFEVNKEAQARLEQHLDTGLDGSITTKLRNADASLEDANWQLAKQPSPDGRFNGVDLQGALRDTRAASEILRQLVPA